jgi:hypothetical protein
VGFNEDASFAGVGNGECLGAMFYAMNTGVEGWWLCVTDEEELLTLACSAEEDGR